MAFVNAQSISINGSTLTNIEGDNYNYTAAAPGERGISELFKASCPDAYHDSLARHPPARCLQGTRADILKEIHEWIAGDNDKHILWLSGPAGSGKSAIAQTIAESCVAKFTLGASFFFFHDSPGRNTAERFVSSIVHQLVTRIPHTRAQIGIIIEDDPSILHKPLSTQFNKLLHSIFASAPIDNAFEERPSARLPQHFLIVIDGLDECKGDRNQREIIEQIGKLSATIHHPFRFLIVSRPEVQIRESFHHLPCSLHNISLGDPQHTLETKDDIYKFLRHSFDEIYHTRHLTTEQFWPGDGVLETLVDKSGGAFIYASTILKYVRDEDYHPVKRLTEILDTPPGLTPLAELDHLYFRILDAHPLPEMLRNVLIFVCLADPPFRRVRSIELYLKAIRSIHSVDYYIGLVTTILTL